MKHPRNYRHTKKQNRHRHIFFVLCCIGLLLLIMVYGILYVSQRQFVLRPLKKLSIPPTRELYYPEPLTLSQGSSDVLGAETIDPKDIVTYINDERMKQHIEPLHINPILVKAAQMRANVILKYENFSHQDPYDHIQLDTVLPLLGYPFIYASENIGMGDQSAKSFVFGFMHSTRHRENLLNPKLLETGTAVVTGPYKQYYVNIAVQIFAVPTNRDTYLGYTKKDIEEYGTLITQVNNQLAATKSFLKKDTQQKEYYERWETILLRQKQILTTLYSAMKEEQPMVNSMVQLIEEYNANWERVPKSPVRT